MKTQAVRFLSILREYLKICIPVTAIILALTSPSLALADSSTQIYARVWNPTGTNSILIVTLRCAVGGCSVPVKQTIECKSNESAGGYHDLGLRGQVGYMLVIAAYSNPDCSDTGFLGYASDYMKSGGDCWFNIPNGNVSGPCTGKTDSSAGHSSSSVS